MNAAPQPATLDSIVLPNRMQPAPNRVTGGAPDAAALKTAADAGIRYVLDIRPESERSFDEPDVVSALGMRFLHLPIAGAQDLTLANARAFDALLAEAGDAPTLLHCASGNRIGAMMALRAAWLQQASSEKALAIGRAYGLTKMEAAVQAVLARGPA
jgi:uncharacterized protein (TIGR01244 family)